MSRYAGIRGSLRFWAIGLVAFYAAWLLIVVRGSHWGTLREHGGIAFAMFLGSYVAGSTPMGGGTVGFPVLVLLFGQPPTLGRDFSFAVQSVGMTSAGLFILGRLRPVEWAMLRWALLGSLIGTPFGVLWIAPSVPELHVKVLFAVLWASFGVLHLFRLKVFARREGLARGSPGFDRNAGFLVGLLGGATVASITGVGVDMAIYCVLVLLCRADLKIAIPTSVILMAATSLVGLTTRVLQGGPAPGVFENWLAAAPVVALGAPLGAFVVQRIGRAPTLYVVSVLCIGQFVWTMWQSRSALGAGGVLLSLLGVLVFNAGFMALAAAGERRGRGDGTPSGAGGSPSTPAAH
jgi:uncharacterized membrane protein YfcA